MDTKKLYQTLFRDLQRLVRECFYGFELEYNGTHLPYTFVDVCKNNCVEWLAYFPDVEWAVWFGAAKAAVRNDAYEVASILKQHKWFERSLRLESQAGESGSQRMIDLIGGSVELMVCGAIRAGHIDIVRRTPGYSNIWSHMAVVHGQLEILKFCKPPADQYEYLINCAVAHNRWAIVDLLISWGASAAIVLFECQTIPQAIRYIAKLPEFTVAIQLVAFRSACRANNLTLMRFYWYLAGDPTWMEDYTSYLPRSSRVLALLHRWNPALDLNAVFDDDDVGMSNYEYAVAHGDPAY